MAESRDVHLNRLREELAPDLEVIRPLGSGRMAEVFLARQSGFDRLVAVKVLVGRLGTDERARARFRREAKASASLDHPNVVEVYRFGQLSDGTPFLVMRYVKGENLANKLAAEGPLPLPEARRILTDLAGALQEAHSRGFVHRDVRPKNVLCDRERDRALLMDFGLAGLLPGAEDSDPRLTRMGETVGTPGYLSPEQILGEETSEGTDMFAFGLLGYEILTGESPFLIKGGLGLELAHLRSEPRPLRALRPDVDPDLDDLLPRCLAKDPRKRPSARYALRALREGSETRGSPYSSAPGQLLDSLITRRMPQIVAVTGVVGFTALTWVGDMEDRSVLPEPSYKLALGAFLAAVATSGVIAWFHGEKGRQRVQPLEVFLLLVVGAAWLTASLWILLT